MKKGLYLVLSLIMLMAVPMTVCASDDPSPDATTQTKHNKHKSTSPKTADNAMTEMAIALFAISGGVLCFAKKELDRA